MRNEALTSGSPFGGAGIEQGRWFRKQKVRRDRAGAQPPDPAVCWASQYLGAAAVTAAAATDVDGRPSVARRVATTAPSG